MRHSSDTIDYIRQTFAKDDSLLENISERMKAYNEPMASIQLGAEEGKLLQLLIKLAKVETIVEIGSLAGYSSVWLARALPEGGIVHAIEKDDTHYNLLCETVKKSNLNIKPHHGLANNVLKELELEAPFDMVFIDADKDGYSGYLDWAENNVRKGGLIIGDNTLLFGHVVHDEYPAEKERLSKAAWKSMREFNKRLSDSSRYESVMIATKEGMTVARKLF